MPSTHVTETVRIDLHCHSSASDGDHSPATWRSDWPPLGVTWASLTDHNTVEGAGRVPSGSQALRHQLHPGRRDRRPLSPGSLLHLLGYGFDPQNEALLAVAAYRPRAVAHFLRVHFERLRGSHRQDHAQPTFRLPARRQRRLADAARSRPEAICLIHEAGGLAFLAHPLVASGASRGSRKPSTWLQPEGLDGLEVFHKSYPEECRTRFGTGRPPGTPPDRRQRFSWSGPLRRGQPWESTCP